MPGNNRNSLAECDLYHGQWVYDDTYPLYRSRNCAFVDRSFRCEENGRPDQGFMKYRWRPHDCDMPRFDAREMLERLWNQRLLFVGDSLGRNQWESMLYMLSKAVDNKSKIYEVNGRSISKHMGELVFLFEDYNCTVEYFRDSSLPFHKKTNRDNNAHGFASDALAGTASGTAAVPATVAALKNISSEITYDEHTHERLAPGDPSKKAFTYLVLTGT